MISKSKVITVE